MPATPPLPFHKRLALDLSDLAVAGDLAPADGAAPPIDVTIRTHFVAMDSLPNPPDDPLRRRDDPTAGLYRQFIAGPRDDFKKVEPVLLEWLRASPERAEEFAEDPAAVIGRLPRVAPEVKARLARYFGPRGPRVMPRLEGLNVTGVSFDAVAADPPPPARAATKSGEDINADAVFQVGFSQLVRVFAEKMLPAIHDAASEVVFPVGGVLATVRLLADRVGDPELERESAEILKMTIGFEITQMEIPPLSLGPAVFVDLGAVTLEARLALSTTNRTSGADVNLSLVANGLTISKPLNLASAPAGSWDAASAQIVKILTPHFAFPVPLQFPAGLCGIAPRKVAAGLLKKNADGIQDSLALAVALLESTDLDTLDPGAVSRVKDGQDGTVFLSNLLMVQVACCLLSQSPEFGALPPADHEATEAEPFCRWEDIENFKLGGEVFDELVYFEISAVNGGIRTELQLKKSGFGWKMTVTVTADMRFELTNGAISAQAKTIIDIDKNVATWVKWVAVLAIIGGAVVIIVGLLLKNYLVVGIGVRIVAFGLLLGVVAIILRDLAGALLPEDLADADELIGLLPTGIGEKLGELSFLTALDWDDLEFGGYMTLPGSPSLVAGGDVILQPGSGIDLDTGEIVAGANLGARMDADLRLHEQPGLVATAMALAPAAPLPGPPSSGGGSPPSTMSFTRLPGIDFTTAAVPFGGRRLEAIGASRLVLFGARPYASIGYFDLVQLGFPQSATQIGVPTAPPPGTDPVVKTFAVRTSAGRLASCAVWTDHARRTNLRYRTFDTPVWLSIEPKIHIQDFGKHGVTDVTLIMTGTFTAVPGPQWPPQPPTSYRWYWSGVELLGSGLLDAIGNHFTIIGNRCQIETVQGADLKGWLCAAASNASGLEAVACRNIHHIGRIPKAPDVPGGGFGGGFGGPGGLPGSDGPGGFGGGFPGGGPHL